MTNPTANEVGAIIMQRRAEEKLDPFPLHADFTITIAAYLKRRGIPYSQAHYKGGVCLTCGEEIYRCPGVHTFEEIQTASRRAQKGNTP